MEVVLLSIGYPPYFYFGGAETYMKLLSKELARKGINVTSIAGWPRKEINIEKCGSMLKVIRLPVIDWPIRTVWYQLLNKNAIIKIIKKADIVHSNNLVVSLINKKIMGFKPLITTMHGSPDALSTYFHSLKELGLSIGDLSYFIEYPLIKNLYFKDLLHSDALIFVSNHGYYEAIKYLGDKSSLITSKSTVIYPWINIKEISVEEPKWHSARDLEVAYVGRLFWSKGVTYAIRAFGIIVNEMGKKAAKLHVIGDGPLRTWILRYSKKNGLTKNINIYGQVSRELVLQTLIKTNVVALPSLYEGCPYVLLESNALGIPVVTFDFKWSREFIKNSLNGFRSPPFDVYKLAESMLKATTLSSSSVKEEAKRYDVRFAINKIIETYQKLM